MPGGRGYGVEYRTGLDGVEYSVSQGPVRPIDPSSPLFDDLAYLSTWRAQEPDRDSSWWTDADEDDEEDEEPGVTWIWGMLLGVGVPGGGGPAPAGEFLADLRRRLPEIVARLTDLVTAPAVSVPPGSDDPFEDLPEVLWQLDVAERYRMVPAWPHWMAEREPELFPTPRSFTTQVDGLIYSLAQDITGIKDRRTMASAVGIWPHRVDASGEPPAWPGLQRIQVTLVPLLSLPAGASAEPVLRDARARFPEILEGIRRLQAEFGAPAEIVAQPQWTGDWARQDVPGRSKDDGEPLSDELL